MSFSGITVTVRAVNRASSEFSRIQSDADALAARIKNLGSVMAGLGAAGVAIGSIAKEMRLLNAEQARVFNSAMAVVSVMGLFLRTSWGVAVAQKVYAAACWVATAAQNALNISYGTFLALTGVGLITIAAAAAAMWSFANSMNAATSSVQSFNDAAAETSSHTRNIQRSGDAALYRQGVEWAP
jgi:hypothetical protein